jgi:hypothetical protein
MTKEKFTWTGFGIPLAWLADLDNVPAPNALADAFGDRYLYRHNPIFANIRNATLDRGYRFSAEDTPLWRDYQSFSLAALNRILSAGTIPYFDTGTTVRRLVAANSRALWTPDFITGNLKRNYAFHESAHCVAHAILQGFETELRTVAPGEADRVVLEAILAESFANTVEVLGSVFEHKPISDRVFYALNSYHSHDQKRQDVLNRAGSELGIELRFSLLFLSHFEANLALEAPADSTYERIAEASGCIAGQAGLSREVTDTGFRLSARFRQSTTPAYFELLGYTGEYLTLVKASWLNPVQNRIFARALVQLLWEAAGKV